MAYCVPIEVDAGNSQDQAVAICENYWSNRDKSMTETVYKNASVATSGDNRRVKFVASDETEDRMGDIIRAKGWDLEDFKRNPVLLWGHNSSEPPIGTVDIGIQGTKLIADATFATEDENPFAERIFKLVKSGIVRAVSVGFSPIEAKLRRDEDGNILGVEYMKQALHELSVVSVPANPNALALAKSLNFSSNDIERVFGPPVVPDSVKRAKQELEFIRLRVPTL